MAGDNKEEKKLIERLQQTYRLVMMNDETFEEVGSYRLTRLNVILAVSSLIVVTALLVVLLIIFTPMKHYIPGYGDVNLRETVEDQAMKIAQMEAQWKADSLYVANVRRMIVGDVETEDDIPEIDTMQDLSGLEIPPIDEENELRQAVEDDKPLVANVDVGNKKNNPTRFSGGSSASLEQLYLISPVMGEVSSGFMPEKSHYGVDVMAPRNTPIKSIMDGIVIQSDWTLETGQTLAVQHKNNVVSFYKHNSVLLKKVGESVNAGEAIAIIGNTGTLSSGPHLHFELWFDGEPVDPVDYLSFN